jgi:hypothetical protein
MSGQTISSASRRSASIERSCAVGTAATMRPAPCFRNAAIAVRIVEPAAMPSSTRITVFSSGNGLLARRRALRRSTFARASALAFSICSGFRL